MFEARVGDTVTLTGVVTGIGIDKDYDAVYVLFPGCGYSKNIYYHTEAVITPKPWEPKIGDTVFPDTSHRHAPYKVNVPHDGLTLVGIHFDPNDQGKRKWAVVAYKGDIPSCIYFEDLRDRPKGPLCVD